MGYARNNWIYKLEAKEVFIEEINKKLMKMSKMPYNIIV